MHVKASREKSIFANAVSPIELINQIWSGEWNGVQIDTVKVRGTFHGDFQFKDYPFDQQHISLKVGHRGLTQESQRFVTDSLGMRLTGDDVTLLQRTQEEGALGSTKG